MKIDLLYNDFKKEIEINITKKNGIIQEELLSYCSLLIYNIENSEIIVNGKVYIFGCENFEFNKTLEESLNNLNNDSNIERFIIYDRKRDLNGNVIKNNNVIDDYNKWKYNHENENYIQHINEIYQTNNIIRFPLSRLLDNILQIPINIINPSTGNYDVMNISNNNVIDTDGSNNNIINTDVINTDSSNDNIINTDRSNNNIINTDSSNDNIINTSNDNIINTSNDNIINTSNDNIINTSNNNIINTSNDNIINTSNDNIINTYVRNIINNSNYIHINTQSENTVNSTTNATVENIFNNANVVNNFNSELNSFINIFDEYIRNNEENYDDLPDLIPDDSLYFINNDVKVVLSDEEFNNINTVEYKDLNTEETIECLICTESFIETDDIKKIKCNHLFHKCCIKKWLCEESNKCPVCRIDIDKGILLH